MRYLKLRPRRLLFEWRDPFDDTLLCSDDFPYNARRSANGFYTKAINTRRIAYKAIFSDVLEGRTPAVRFTMTR
jgi:hypothetical protein